MGAVQSQEITARQYARVEKLVARVMAAPAKELAGLRALSPDMLKQVDAYKAANASVAALERSAAKEVKESLEAMKPVSSFYDQAREVAMAKLPGVTFLAASSHKTPQDFLNQAEELEDALEEQAAAEAGAPEGTAWAGPLFEAMIPLLDAAVKELNEATGAMAELQKAQARRASAAGAARPVFVQFRRVVRSTFGRSSREYRSLLDGRGQIDTDDPDEPVAPPVAPPAPTEPGDG